MHKHTFCGALLALAVLGGCSESATGPVFDTAVGPGETPVHTEQARPSSTTINPRMLRRFKPLPITAAVEDGDMRERVDLGRMLFFDPRLSLDGTVSCNSCHELTRYGVDGKKVSTGYDGRKGTRNAPTVFNASGFFAQFWDGRAPTLEVQATMPILNPVEMAMPDEAHVVESLRGVPEYPKAFEAAFPGEPHPLSLGNVGRAIAAFERGLATPSRWDNYLRGDEAALSAGEKEGLRVFLDVGCMVCHTGTFLGGSMFERAGAVEPWPDQTNRGRERVTHQPGDAMMFKVPTLRNVTETAPYFHDGSAATLPEAVRMMGKHQLGIELADREVTSMITWFGSLRGTIPADYIAMPRLSVATIAVGSP